MKTFLHRFKQSVHHGWNSSDVLCYCRHSAKWCAGVPVAGWHVSRRQLGAGHKCNAGGRETHGVTAGRAQGNLEHNPFWAEGHAKVLSRLLLLIAGDIYWVPPPALAGQLCVLVWGVMPGQASPAASEVHVGSGLLLLGQVSMWFWLLWQFLKGPEQLGQCAAPAPMCHPSDCVVPTPCFSSQLWKGERTIFRAVRDYGYD